MGAWVAPTHRPRWRESAAAAAASRAQAEETLRSPRPGVWSCVVARSAGEHREVHSHLVRKPKQIDELTVAWRAPPPILPLALSPGGALPSGGAHGRPRQQPQREPERRPPSSPSVRPAPRRCAFPFPPDTTQAHELRPRLYAGSIVDPLQLEPTKAKCAPRRRQTPPPAACALLIQLAPRPVAQRV